MFSPILQWGILFWSFYKVVLAKRLGPASDSSWDRVRSRTERPACQNTTTQMLSYFRLSIWFLTVFFFSQQHHECFSDLQDIQTEMGQCLRAWFRALGWWLYVHYRFRWDTCLATSRFDEKYSSHYLQSCRVKKMAVKERNMHPLEWWDSNCPLRF